MCFVQQRHARGVVDTELLPRIRTEDGVCGRLGGRYGRRLITDQRVSFASERPSTRSSRATHSVLRHLRRGRGHPHGRHPVVRRRRPGQADGSVATGTRRIGPHRDAGRVHAGGHRRGSSGPSTNRARLSTTSDDLQGSVTGVDLRRHMDELPPTARGVLRPPAADGHG